MHTAWFFLSSSPEQQKWDIVPPAVSLTFKESVWLEHSVPSADCVLLRGLRFISKTDVEDNKAVQGGWEGLCHMHTIGIKTTFKELVLFFLSCFWLYCLMSNLPPSRLHYQKTNDGKLEILHLRFFPPTDELITVRIGSCERKFQPNRIPRFPLVAIICSHSAPPSSPPPSLLCDLTAAGVELSSSNPLKEGKQKSKSKLFV